MTINDKARLSRADLHVHSKYSDRPSEWFLRRIGSPESFVEPLALYNTCREHGMDYVTITDHNSINGALEIAHLPGTFLSSEQHQNHQQNDQQFRHSKVTHNRSLSLMTKYYI